MPSNVLFSNISNKSAGDRFIPNRSDCDINLAHFKLIGKNQKISDDIFRQKPNQFFPYIKLLQNTIKYTESPILNFNRAAACTSNFKQKELNIILPPWPVNPRLNPVLIKPNIVLDLPNVTSDIVSNMLDWGSSDVIATISNNKVYLWSNKLEQYEEVADTNIPAYKALKWSHDGRYLAVAHHRAVAIWDMIKLKEISNQVCICPNCYPTSLAWDKTDKFMVTGCSEGIIQIWYWAAYPKPLFAENSFTAHYNCIITLEFSTNNKYLCSSSVDGLVRLWHWPIIEPHFEISSTSPVRGIAFHPWKDAILAVGGGLGDGSLSVWNVNNFKRIDYLKPTQESFVDCLAWNRVTGELVSSHQVANKKKGTMDTKILVLSSLNRVVDVIDEHKGRVLYLMWDSTGTKLATAGSEENLCIWNFLGKKYSALEKSVCKRKTKRSSKDVMIFGKGIR